MSVLALGVLGQGLVDPETPVLHADDQGLQRGRAAFETLRVYGGKPFGLTEHLDRIAGSAERIGLPPVSRTELEELARLVVEAGGEQDCVLRFYWTGGRESGDQATALAMVSPLPAGYEELRARGTRLIALQLGVAASLRASSPWLLGGVKSTSYAVNMAAEAEAKRRGADDAVFVDHTGLVLEGPTTNVWWRREHTLFTPALDLGILAGVTRATATELAIELGYEVAEGAYRLAELASAEEAFTTSSIREVMPVTELDGTPIARGPAADELQAALRRAAGATLRE